MKAPLALLACGTVLLGVAVVSLRQKAEASMQIYARSGWYYLPQPTTLDRLAYLGGVVLVMAGAGFIVFSFLRHLWRKSS